MGINKVIFDNTAIIDLTDATATAEKIIEGYTAYGKDGELITGVAAGTTSIIITLDELLGNWDNEAGFIISYDNVTTGTQYITNTVTTSKGIYVETALAESASTWYLEQVSGYTNRFYIYTLINNEKQYMFNDTGSNVNFMNLSTTSKAAFDITYEADGKFLFKISTKNAWLQHSNSGGGIRLYTDHNNANNTQFSLTYNINSIVPYGTLEITENGTYDTTIYKKVIVNV